MKVEFRGYNFSKIDLDTSDYSDDNDFIDVDDYCRRIYHIFLAYQYQGVSGFLVQKGSMSGERMGREY